jgi:DNA-binding MarR family transcriptional regulator
MDATTTNRADFTYDGAPPVLIAASGVWALARARQTIDGAGFRIGAALPLEEARVRVEQQPSTSAVWIEIGEDGGDTMDDLLAMVARDVADGRYAAVVSTIPDMLDPVMAGIGDASVDVIVDAGDMERAAALALVTSERRVPYRVSDVAADRSAEQLRQLSEEVNRIASMLSRLSNGPGPVPPAIQPMHSGDVPSVSVETVRKIIRARRLRSRYFSEELFADPAWDMLLDLMQAELAHLRVPVSSLCIAAAVPATTALRWLKTMVKEGLFIRRADPHDGRRVFVELAPDTRDAMHRYFAEVEGLLAV